MTPLCTRDWKGHFFCDNPKSGATLQHEALERRIERQIARGFMTLKLGFFDERKHCRIHFSRMGGTQEMLATLDHFDSRLRGLSEQLDCLLGVRNRVNWIRSTLPEMSLLYLFTR